jgi:hypothetical protein
MSDTTRKGPVNLSALDEVLISRYRGTAPSEHRVGSQVRGLTPREPVVPLRRTAEPDWAEEKGISPIKSIAAII